VARKACLHSWDVTTAEARDLQLRLGLAAHLGLWLGIPTIGCAKSWFFGEYDEPGPERGVWSPLTDQGATIGAVLRTRTGIKPVFVSSGHLCNLKSAIEVVLAASPTYRQPITTRLAHQYVNELRMRGVPNLAKHLEVNGL
jgi:deoxyribonuclease V